MKAVLKIEEEIATTVRRLREQGSDDVAVEAKTGVGKDVWRTVSAFANSRTGGRILFGLQENQNFSAASDFDPVSVTDAVVTGLGDEEHEGAKVRPKPEYRISTVPFEGTRLVSVDIEPLTPLNSDAAGPCYVILQGPVAGAYKRVADQNQTLSGQESYNIHSRWGPREYDSDPIDGMELDDIDEDLKHSLFQKNRSSGSRALLRTENDTERLMRLKVVAPNGAITLAGGLMLGKYPQQFFPRLVIDVTVHPHEAKDVVGQTRFLDRKVCDGPIPYMIQDAITRVMANLKNIRVVRGTQGVDEAEIPEDVLREAVTNAVMHRDYSNFSRGERISIDIFPDRVEIINPGGLAGDRTQENIAEGKSVTRNQTLATLLRTTPIPEQHGVLAEAQGSGIPRMKAGMRQQGLPQPEFYADIVSVKVTLQRHGLLDQETRVWLDQLPKSIYRQHRENLTLALLFRRGQATVQSLRAALGYDSDDVRGVLGNLMADELIEGLGDGPFRIATRVSSYATAAKSGVELSDLELEIYNALSPTEQKNIREIAEELDRTVNSLRPILRGLVATGLVAPTAPPQSRHRAYLKQTNLTDG